MENIITINKLTKVYGESMVLDIPELNFRTGESVGVVGNNGAGKTTLFRLILDLIEPSGGSVKSKGIDVRETEEWKNYTGSFLDESFLIDYLSPDEYFDFIARLSQLSREEASDFLSQMESIFKGEVIGHKKLIRDLSKGNQKKVGTAAALMTKPEILVLDEPFANLDPSTQFQLRDLLKRLDNDTDTTMIISSHDLVHVAEFCQRIIILDKGKVVKDIMSGENTLNELKDFFIREIREELNIEENDS